MEEEKVINTSFQVKFYGSIDPINELVSKGRVRIFYKGLNRNNTFISDSFAEKLLSTISYSPIKGIYNSDEFSENDFEGHGRNKEELKKERPYGFVPPDPNIAYEKHLDDDGVERLYACADAIIWTKLYPESKEIFNKAESMELYGPSIKGSWKIIDGIEVYEFEDAKFFGLQVLGNKVEPCFEGAAFFSLLKNFESLLFYTENYLQQTKTKGGQKMVLNFKLSDSNKYEKIWRELNPQFNEENNWIQETAILDIYDDYAFCYNYENHSYFRVYYTKDNETDMVTLGETVAAFIIDVTESELKILNSLKDINNGSFDLINEKIAKEQQLLIELTDSNAALQEKIVQYETQVLDLSAAAQDDLTKEIEELKVNYEKIIEEKDSEKSKLEEEKNNIENERQILEIYKYENEKEKKLNVIEQYSSTLSEQILQPYYENIDKYEIEDLKKELAFELVKSSPETFNLNVTKEERYFTKLEPTKTDELANLLSKYEKKNYKEV